MLTPEQAKELQQRRQRQNVEPRRLQAIAQLPEPLRPTAYGLLFHDERGQSLKADYTHNRQKERIALLLRSRAQLDALPPGERALIFGALFPSMAEQIERGWTYLHRLPYQGLAYHHLEFFRAPNRPDATFEARGAWLQQMLGAIAPDDDILWLARHVTYVSPYAAGHLGLLFAAVIDGDPARGDELFDVLVRSARGEDEIGTFGYHIPVALLAASRPDGWEVVERLLLGAQREEGVRQTILEALGAAHPAALRGILGTVIEHNLVRFSAVTRVVDGWLGTAWDSSDAPKVARVLRALHAMLGDAHARSAALESGGGEDAYLALWATACEDIYAALPLAERLLDDADVARRYAATRLLAAARMPEAIPPLLRALGDPDPRIVAQACAGLNHSYYGESGERLRQAPDAFERIEALLPALPRHVASPQPLLWNVTAIQLDRERVSGLLLDYLGDRAPRRLIPYLGLFSGSARVQAAERLAKSGLGDPEARAALLNLLGDRASYVREQALKLLLEAPIPASDAPALEALLTRKSGDLRQGVLRLLLKQSDEQALGSAERLVAAANERQRFAGLEALRLLHQAGRAPAACKTQAAAYRQRREELTEAEQALLAPILDGEREAPTLENALGLARPDELTPPVAPEPREHAWTSPAAVASLQALDELIHEHRADVYVVENWQGRRELMLGADVWFFPSTGAKTPIEDDAARLPFAELWRGWMETRGEALRDADGFETLRMLLQLNRRGADETRAILAGLGFAEAPRLGLRYPALLEKLCWWLVRLYPPAGGPDFLLDHLETALTQIPESELREPEDPAQRPRYREYQKLQRAVALARTYAAYNTRRPDAWTGAHHARLWRLLSWSVTLPQPHLRYRPQLGEALAVHRAGAASEADLVYQFLGPRQKRGYSYTIFDELHTFSARKPHPLLVEYPTARAVYDRCVRRVLEIELRRGETPTAATEPALSLRSLTGAGTFLATLRALGDERLARGSSYGDRGKPRTLSHLLRVTFPTLEDTPDAFRDLARAANIPERRLVEAAVYAPQWGQHIERALGWDGFAQSVWWVHAHTKDRSWSVDKEIREEWETAISEWTPLASDDLYDGAVDVAWFRRVIAALGVERWEALYDAALYASGGAGHTRARLFADALLGRADAAALAERITAKRNRDAACALGLLSLPKAPAAREKALLARYQTLQEYIRTSQTFGAQRREGDQKAARIGLENLARTAGYADPQRFQWAMELKEVADLAAGPLSVARDAVTLTLRVDALGQPQLSVEKAGKPLKDIPPRLKKDPDIVALRERKKRLEQQSARMRGALEEAMCRAEPFTAGELAGLLRHPLLAPMLEQLVFASPTHMGYLTSSGAALHTLDGDVPLAPDTTLRIAHPHDLYASGELSRYQHECFASERIQPFKQVFRELYPLTEAERRDGARSLRYAGQQIQPQQAMALLAARGWKTSAQDGAAARTFHGQGVTVSVDFLYGGGTPVDVEGLTVESVSFRPAGQLWGQPLPLQDIPPALFSEAMRDLDLVVSVAHRGGVDPEGSASTVEMRAALLREVCAALALTNVRLQLTHAVITGALGEYSLHLGSGSVHRLPGGALCIIPVHAQHRGRVFLPFADDDPKTAEIVSKVLLLARDTEIKDPLILQQLYARV
jgi:HEAT repeat protein